MVRRWPGPAACRRRPGPRVAQDLRSSLTIAELLMSSRCCPRGNVYRAEVLYRAGLDPYLKGRDSPASSGADMERPGGT